MLAHLLHHLTSHLFAESWSHIRPFAESWSKALR